MLTALPSREDGAARGLDGDHEGALAFRNIRIREL